MTASPAAPAAMPSEEDLIFEIVSHAAKPYGQKSAQNAARAILDLFAPILAEKQKPTVALNHWKARALAAEAALAKAIVFEVGEHHFVESRGDGTWAIKNGGCVLNVDGVWEWEPSPSNRTDEFIARTRFDRDDAFRRAAAIRAQGE